MNSLAEENYLKALLTLSKESGEVNVNTLSKRLGIKMPTVTSMMKKLAGKKLVQHESYKPLRLTPKGKKEALLILRKHRLVEMFLVEKMNFGWEEVHEIAEQIEHLHSPHFFERMDEMLDYPRIDPHGEPIPDKAGKMESDQYLTLSSCKTGDTVKLRAAANSSSDFLKSLTDRGLRLGLNIRIRSIEPFDRSFIVSYGKRHSETLSHTICDRLLVEKI